MSVGNKACKEGKQTQLGPRCVCAITDFALATSDSIYQEDILLIENSHQEVFQDLQKAALARLNP